MNIIVNIVDDVKKILKKEALTINELNMVEILSLLQELLKPNDKKYR